MNRSQNQQAVTEQIVNRNSGIRTAASPPAGPHPGIDGMSQSDALPALAGSRSASVLAPTGVHDGTVPGSLQLLGFRGRAGRSPNRRTARIDQPRADRNPEEKP